MTENTENKSIQERVNDICDEMYAQNTKPTVRLVLSKLQDVRSTSTVHKYFSKWKKEKEDNQQSLYDKLGFSPEFTNSFMKEITRFGIEAEQRYKQQALDANDQRDVAIEELERSEERLYKQNASLEQKDKIIKELEIELVKLQEKNKSDVESLNQSHEAVVSELRAQIDVSSNECKQLTETNEVLRTSTAKMELKLEGNQAFTDEVKQQNSELTEANKKLNKQIAELTSQLARNEATITGNDRLIENLESAVSNTQSQLSDSEKERHSESLKHEAARKELELINKETQSKSKQLAEAQQVIVELKRVNEEQSAVIAKLT